ncbi:MAG: hypothetical protein ACI396_01935, partial [Acutalibacteraceae bacterium]
FGGVIYYLVITLVIQIGLNPNYLKLFSALVVALFLGVPYWKSKIAPKRVKTAAVNNNTDVGGESNA